MFFSVKLLIPFWIDLTVPLVCKCLTPAVMLWGLNDICDVVVDLFILHLFPCYFEWHCCLVSSIGQPLQFIHTDMYGQGRHRAFFSQLQQSAECLGTSWMLSVLRWYVRIRTHASLLRSGEAQWCSHLEPTSVELQLKGEFHCNTHPDSSKFYHQ